MTTINVLRFAAVLFLFSSSTLAYDCWYLSSALQSDGTYRHLRTGELFSEPRSCTKRCDGVPKNVTRGYNNNEIYGQVQSCPWVGGIKGFRGSNGKLYGFQSFCSYRLVGGVEYDWPGYYQLTTK